MSKSPSNLLQSSTLPPAQPDYVLRGHTAQIHSVHFLRQNLRLLTGDADGWVILWNLAIKRPVAVWKAHGGSVLGVGSWGLEEENITTCAFPIRTIEAIERMLTFQPDMDETTNSSYGSYENQRKPNSPNSYPSKKPHHTESSPGSYTA